MVKWIILAVLLLPVAEIATFVVVAMLIGFGWALLLMLATTVAGFVVLKQAGRSRLANFGAAVTGSDTTEFEANAGSFLGILAGILLFLPGFLTDLAGAALLLPPVRRACAARFQTLVKSRTGSRSVVDLEPDEWHQVPDTPREPDQTDRH
jgi:UPF0716 protein FxsA